MKPKTMTWMTTIVMLATLAAPIQLTAQEHEREHPRYKLIDVGTFGGPDSVNQSPNVILNNEGTVAGAADTSVPDPYAPNCFDPECFVQHAFVWKEGVLTDLGVLSHGYSSYPNSINSHDQIVGQSQNGLIDAVTDMPEIVATVWQYGQIFDLGTFGGGFSLATANNNRGQVIGCAFNDIPDSFTPSGVFYGLGFDPRQLRAFRWHGKQLHDLGTLGGPDACAIWLNDSDQITGASFVDSTANPDTGLPTLDPFLWEHGKMTDLGTLGGTVGFANMINNRGQIIGQSSLAGNPGACLTFASGCHGFLWLGGALNDLRALGGTVSGANWINDAGVVVGYANLPGDQIFHAAVWRNGVIADLGTLNGDCSSVALSINSEGQIVGQSFSCDFSVTRAVLWNDDGSALDLNNLVHPGSGLQLTEPKIINDGGEMVLVGLLPNGNVHSVLLIPCEGEHSDEEGCEDGAAGAADVRGESGENPKPAPPTTIRSLFQRRLHFNRLMHD